MRNKPSIIESISYPNRIMFMLACVLVVMILLFKYWGWNVPERQFSPPQPDFLTIEDIIPTRQISDATPPPVRPRVGPPVPADVILEDELDQEILVFETGPAEVVRGSAGSPGIVEHPDQPPRVRRIVEAVKPETARGLDTRIEIWFIVLVNQEGRVEEVTISEIVQLDEQGNRIIIDNIGYGLLDEAKRAAAGWLFLPARHNGEPVKSYSTHRFTFRP